MDAQTSLQSPASLKQYFTPVQIQLLMEVGCQSIKKQIATQPRKLKPNWTLFIAYKRE